MHSRDSSFYVAIIAFFVSFCSVVSAGDNQAVTDKSATIDIPAVQAILAIESDPDYGEYLGSECLACHSASDANSTIPKIHGRDKTELIVALLEYRDKTRENLVMQGIAGNLSDEDIAALVAHLSQP